MRRLALLALACLSLSCTAAQIQGWELALAALGAAAPSVCSIVYDTSGAQAGKVCGTAAPAVASLASWLASVLATIPVAAKAGVQGAAMGSAMPPVSYDLPGLGVGGHVDLRADLAGPVCAAAKARAK